MAVELSDILKAVNADLPGEYAHRQLAPIGRNLVMPDSKVKIAAVLCLLYPVNQQWHIIFIERTSKNKKDKHGGQIGFPGGMLENADKDLLACALREANEEIGLEIERTSPVRALTPLYIPVSNFQVHPFLAYTHHQQKFILQQSEVKKVLSFSIEELLHPANVKQVVMDVGTPSFKMEVPAYCLDKAVIWGATAMMLHECVVMLKDHLDLP
jgi:8-oxo-dGTP pyrophosphatase MutT (NUDIX family)